MPSGLVPFVAPAGLSGIPAMTNAPRSLLKAKLSARAQRGSRALNYWMCTAFSRTPVNRKQGKHCSKNRQSHGEFTGKVAYQQRTKSEYSRLVAQHD